MGNYAYSIVTRSIIKKYHYYSHLTTSLIFGEKPDYSKEINFLYNKTPLPQYKVFTKANIMTVSLLPYGKNSVRQAIKQMKFNYNKRYCNLFAEITADFLLTELIDLETFYNFRQPIMCIVPSHVKTIRDRNGYYSTHHTAKRIVHILGEQEIDFQPKLLTKTRFTQQQSRMTNKKDRLKNPLGSFSHSKHVSIVGRNIIIFDDVYTTGATIDECTKVLHKAGAARIMQITIAH